MPSSRDLLRVPQPHQFPGNRLLAALPADSLARLSPHLTEITLELGHSLFKADQPIRHVCFPDSGVCSVMTTLRNGTTIEVSTVGNEGMIGLALYFGETTELNDAIVQVAGHGRILAAETFEQEMASRGIFHRLIGLYAHTRMIQVVQSVACNQLHTVEQRVCRWLLMTHDRVQGDTFKLTHELFGLMLGVRRSSVTSIASKLQRAGSIEYRHGSITIKNRARLESASCECYQVSRNYFELPFRKLAVMHIS
jgi:CRP-like cAMP-binding protein